MSELPFLLPDGEPAPPMVDLAVNRDGDVYTSGYIALYRIDPETAVATHVGDFRDETGQLLDADLDVNLYALTFVPRALYPDATVDEVLIGAANEGDCYEVDVTTAVSRHIGSYPAAWRSSGDLVSVERLGTTFATLERQDALPEEPDYLAEVTFRAGGAIELNEPLAIQDPERVYTQIFGLGYWGRDLYGFSNAGELIEINRDTGVGQLATADTGALEFWGAGVTTQVPVLY